MNREIIITYDMIDLFKKKYGFTNVELAGIFGEECSLFYGKKSGDILKGIKDPAYVFDLMSDSKKLKQRVEKLYENNVHARKIYHKVFKDDENNMEAIYNVDELIKYKKRLGISTENFASILGIKGYELRAVEEGKRNYFLTKVVDLNYYLNDDKAFYDLAFKACKEGKITKKIMTTISSRLGSLSKEGKIKDKVKYVIKNPTKTVTKVTKNNNEKVNKNRDITNRRINELRNRSKNEERKELNGGKVSYTARTEFIKALYDLYENGEKITSQDIDIVKKAIIYNEDIVSTEAIKLCILGTYRSYGYNATMIITNRLISELDKKIYGSQLQEFKTFIQESHAKKLKEEELKRKNNQNNESSQEEERN